MLLLFKMKLLKKIIILVMVIVILAVSLFVFYRNEPKVCFEWNCFYVEVVDTPIQREKGLMNRESMDLDRGMFFVFEQERLYQFWMKNTLIPLDIIWISSNKEIVYIEHNAQPCKEEECPIISPLENAKYVLEINGELTSEKGIYVGQNVEFIDFGEI